MAGSTSNAPWACAPPHSSMHAMPTTHVATSTGADSTLDKPSTAVSAPAVDACAA